MGRIAIVDPFLFPESCRYLVSLPYDAGSEVYAHEMKNISTRELEETLEIFRVEYPGRQMQRKQRIQAEINRRKRMKEKTGFAGARLPRNRTWGEDFARLWEEACRPFREARL